MNRYPIIYNQYGSAAAHGNIFTIYTTGICNWASFDDSNQNLIKITFLLFISTPSISTIKLSI